MIQRNESPDDPLTAAEAAVILSKNSKKVVKPAYLNQLVRQGRLKPYKLDGRTNLYRRGDVELIIVASRGGKHMQNHSKRRITERQEKSVA